MATELVFDTPIPSTTEKEYEKQLLVNLPPTSSIQNHRAPLGLVKAAGRGLQSLAILGDGHFVPQRHPLGRCPRSLRQITTNGAQRGGLSGAPNG